MKPKPIFTLTVSVDENADVRGTIEMIGDNNISNKRVANALEMIINGLREEAANRVSD